LTRLVRKSKREKTRTKKIKDSIQLMGEMLVNTGRVVSLSAVFQNLNQTPNDYHILEYKRSE